MKITKILLFNLLLISLILPYVTFAYAADKPSYVGVNEDQEIVWNTEFDKGPIEDFLAVMYPAWTEQQISDYAHEWFDYFEIDDDAVKWKVIVTDIGEEKDMDYKGQFLNEKDINYVKISFSIYDQEEGEEWDSVDKLEKIRLYEGEERVYADMVIESMDDIGFGLGFLTKITIDPAPVDQDVEWPCFFVPKNLKWGDVCDEVEDKLEHDVSPYNRRNKYDVGTEDVDFFFREKDVGLSTTVEGQYSPIEDFDAEIKFNDNGIMYYYEWMYDGDTIMKFELDTIGGVYLIENWWWIALIAGAIIIGIIVIVVVIAMKRR